MGFVAVEAAAMELQRALLVARLMDVDPEWGKGPTAAPGWWLETWARRLAGERLSPLLSADVLAWLERVTTTLAERDTLTATAAGLVLRQQRGELLRDWLVHAELVREEGTLLEARVAAELTF